MPRFITYNYQGYKVALRTHDERVKKRKILDDEAYRIWPYFNGSNLRFDLWIVATKSAVPNTVFNYKWVLCSPDGEQEFNSGNDTADMSSIQSYKGVLDLGHFSATRQYRIDIIMTFDDEKAIRQTFLDFKVHDLDQFYYNVFLLFIAAVITLVLGGIARGCGMQ